MALETSYQARATGSQSSGPPATASKGEYWPLEKLRKCYTDYQFSKREEIDEQIDARRYYHGSQWTAEQIAVMKKRKQPVMTFNRIGRKVDGVVGLIERLRQDPKAYARTPQHEEGAELATAVLRYVMDQQRWKEKSPECASDGAIDGIGGIEIEIIPGDQGDAEIGLNITDTQAFFYDPRSYMADFSDALYMGVGKWLDEDTARSMFPDAPDDAFSSDEEMVGDTDRESRWFQTDGVQKRVRIVDIWYQHKGGWCYCLFSGSSKLQEGKSYLIDEKGKPFCKYLMFSGNVDQDGDRYGFIRNMKSAQDGINARQSKMQHILVSRRLILSQGAVDDVEVVRREWARPDGVILTNMPVNDGVKSDDQSFDFAGWTKMLEMNLAEIENFGPNPALIGQGIENKSGRAIALLQQAGIAELGPYILAFKGWKLRVYRAIWNAVQQHWQAERWIRVTDNEEMAQYIQVNGLGIDPQTGMPTIVNGLGSLDVDIILDEGPDQVNMMADAYDTLTVMAGQGTQVPPQLLVELSPLPISVKKRATDILEKAQQSPQAQLQAAGAQAQVENEQADTQLKQAQAAKALSDAHMAPLEALMNGQGQPVEPQEYEVPPELQNMQAMAEIEERTASAQHKRAQAFKTEQEGMLAPEQMRMDAMNADADRKAQAQIAKQRASKPNGSQARR